MLAEKFGVSERTVGGIKNGKGWKHLDISRDANASHADSQTGVKGISPYMESRYQVHIMVKGKRHYLGIFNTLEGAKQVLDAWKAEYQNSHESIN